MDARRLFDLKLDSIAPEARALVESAVAASRVDEGILGLAIGGSAVTDRLDEYSDLDLVVFVGVRILIALARPHFMTAVTGSALDVRQGSWILSASYYMDAQGHHVSFEQVNQMVSVYASTAPKTFNGSGVMDYLHQRGISLLTDDQPLDRFWAFQLVEAALFLGLTIGLIAACLRWLQRRA